MAKINKKLFIVIVILIFISVLVFCLISTNSLEKFSSNDYLNALDGDNNPVTWWVAYKLPSTMIYPDDIERIGKGDTKNLWWNSNDSYSFMRKLKDKNKFQPASIINDYHCSCSEPDCSGSCNEKSSDYGYNRGSGLCYLYADSNNPEFKYFKSYGYDCLGQGGKDPLSNTLKQVYDNLDDKEIQWSLWNDQTSETSDSYRGKTSFPESINNPKNVNNAIYPHKNSGCDRPGAHSKGFLAFKNGGGFLLQSSSPMYPDPSCLGSSKKAFVKLCCQLSNSCLFSQNMFCISLSKQEIEKAVPIIGIARICSSMSPSCYNVATDSQNIGYGITNKNFKCQSNNLEPEVKNYLSYKDIKKGSDSIDLNIGANGSKSDTITLIAKSRYDLNPPWMIVAGILESDLTVMSWWSPDYGAPSICRGTKYNNTTNKFCLDNEKTPYITSINVTNGGSGYTSAPSISFLSNSGSGVAAHSTIDSSGKVNKIIVDQQGWGYTTPTTVVINNDGGGVGATAEAKQDINYLGMSSKSFLKADGHPYYNIEMIIALTFGKEYEMPIYDVNKQDFSQFALGGVFAGGNHAKLGISTPSSPNLTNNYYFISGDMNHEGYPGKLSCSDSQYGRGGLFYALKNEKLWTSFKNAISSACSCSKDSAATNHFCGFGSYPGKVWWETGAVNSENVLQPWHFHQMTVEECVKNGVDPRGCIGTGYQEYGDYFNKGFNFPTYNESVYNSFWNNNTSEWKWQPQNP